MKQSGCHNSTALAFCRKHRILILSSQKNRQQGTWEQIQGQGQRFCSFSAALRAELLGTSQLTNSPPAKTSLLKHLGLS